VLLKSLETLPVRVRAQCASAAEIAAALEGKPGVLRVLFCGSKDHPQAELGRRQMSGGGQVITFEVDGGKRAAFRFLNAL
jgi:O-succinylhomoserine sulfhydrylase